MDDLQALRQELHQHPELSGEEHETRKRVRKFLERVPEFTLVEIADTGLLAIWKTGKAGPRVLVRAELDALPIKEDGHLSYASKMPGVAHLCGHDGHASILCGLALALQKNPPACGEVVLCFQPAEEIGAGAQKVLNDPVFKDYEPDWVFALHNIPGYPLGSVLAKSGTFTAAVKSLVFRLHGKTAHAGEPEHGINPVWMLAELLPQLQSLEQADAGQPDFRLITPVHLRVGEQAYGVSPGYAELHLTIRSFTNKEMDSLHRALSDLVETLAKTHSLKVEEEVVEPFKANENGEVAVGHIKAAAQHLGLPFVSMQTPFRWGEDFGYLSSRYPGAMFGLGSGENQPALHHPDYDFPDELLKPGVQLFEFILQRILR